MKYLWILLAVVGLIVTSRAIGSAHANADEDYHATLFTPALTGNFFVCSAVNVSDETLKVVLTIIDGDDGTILNTKSNPTLAPGLQLDTNPQNPKPYTSKHTAYCKAEVNGEDAREAVRVDLGAQTLNSDGSLDVSKAKALQGVVQGH